MDKKKTSLYEDMNTTIGMVCGILLLIIIATIGIASTAAKINPPPRTATTNKQIKEKKDYIMTRFEGYTVMQSLVLSLDSGMMYKDLNKMLENSEELVCEIHYGAEGDLGRVKYKNDDYDEKLEVRFYESSNKIMCVIYETNTTSGSRIYYAYYIDPEGSQYNKLKVNGEIVDDLNDRNEVFNYINSILNL